MAKASNVISIGTSKNVINLADEKLARASEREAKKIANATEKMHMIFVRERQRDIATQEEKGKVLFEMQQLLRIEGTFVEWLQQFIEQYDFSVQTAYNYIEIYKKSPAGLKAILKPKPVRSKGRGGRPKGSTGSRGARHTGTAKGGDTAPPKTAAATPPPGGAADQASSQPSQVSSGRHTAAPPSSESGEKIDMPPSDTAAIIAAFMKLSPAVVNSALAERGWCLMEIEQQRDIADTKEENRRLKASIDKLQAEYDKLKGELDKRTGKAPPAPVPIDHETITKGFLAADDRKQFDFMEKIALHDRADLDLAKRKVLWAQKIYNWLPTEPVDLRKDFRERIKYSKHEAEPHPDDQKKPPAPAVPRVPSNEVNYRRQAPPGSLLKGNANYGRQDGRQSTFRPNGNGKGNHEGFN